MTGGRRSRAAPVLAASLAVLAGAAFGGTVSRVSAVSTSAGLELRVFAAGISESRIFLLQAPGRIVLDIAGAETNTAAPSIPVNSGGVKTIRTAQYKPDVVRIVIDLDGGLPTYRLSRVAAGFLLLFPRELTEAPPVIEVVKPKAAESMPAAAPAAVPANPSAESRPGADSQIKIIPQDAAPLAVSVPAPKAFRISAAADVLLFRDETLASVYGKPAGYGGRVDVRLSDFAGFWAGLDYLRRSAAVSGATRTVRIIPIEAGVKFVMSRGMLAPYIGFGAAYFLFREETPSGTVSRDAFGWTSLAGVLLRLGPTLTLDFCARYRRLPVDLALRSFDAGGFHFGGAFGLAF
jgi:hypothetical protein